MANAAYSCQLQISSASAFAFSGGTTTMLAANEYEINNTALPVSPDFAVSVYDNGVLQSAADYRFNYAWGRIKKVSGNFTGPVTVDYRYLLLYNAAEIRSFELNFTREAHDVTVMSSTTAAHARSLGLKDLSGSLTGFDPLTTDLSGGSVQSIFADWQAGSRRVLNITFPSGLIFRAFIKFTEIPESAALDGLLESTVNFVLDSVTGTGQTEGTAFGFSSGNPNGYDP